jgi:hypothetical protein
VIEDCRKLHLNSATGFYRIASAGKVTDQLSGSRLPLGQSEVTYLTIGGGHEAQWIIAASSGNADLPVLAKSAVDGREVFFATRAPMGNGPVTSDPYREPEVFAQFATPILFLRYAAGNRAWHSPGYFANLTIDDAWLREPYGHIIYKQLLREMQLHNFHTTIAFIPWNFDRSKPAMVSLFQNHADRFSLCVHGNNHYHQEFGPYDSKPLNEQVNDIKQAVARMAKFSELTGLPYDRVMVFPHSIAPDETLAALKRYNFSSTANSLNVPLGAQPPNDPEFALRTVSLAFSNFPSLRRYSAEAPRPESQLAIDAFLGNPMLFYVHHNFFALGIDAFNKVADAVNQLQSDTQWRSLGDITRHLYLEKLRDDGNYDVRAFTATIRLDNNQKHNATFFVEKEENFTLPLTVLVDGQSYPYERSGTKLRLQLPIQAGTGREITVQYKNDLIIAGTEISKTSFLMNTTRQLSDFRDNVVSRSLLGRKFTVFYTSNENIWNAALLGLAALLAGISATLFMRHQKRSVASRRISAASSRS